jgi:hypothetical protein
VQRIVHKAYLLYLDFMSIKTIINVKVHCVTYFGLTHGSLDMVLSLKGYLQYPVHVINHLMIVQVKELYIYLLIKKKKLIIY